MIYRRLLASELYHESRHRLHYIPQVMSHTSLHTTSHIALFTTYCKSCHTLFATYRKSRHTLFATYRESCHTLFATYRKSRHTLFATYR